MGTLDDGLTTKLGYDHSSDELIVGRFQDCDPIVADAKARHNEGMHGSADMKHAARIPLVIFEKYANDNNLEFSEVMQNPQHLKNILNDPSLSAFRIWPGKV